MCKHLMWLALTYLLFPRCGDKNPSCLSSSSLFHASPHEAKPIFLLRLLIQFSLLLQSHTPCHPLLKPFCSSVIFFCLSLRSPLCVCLISPQTSNLFRSGQELPAVLSVALQFQHMKTSLSLSLSHWSTKRRRFIWGSTGLKKKSCTTLNGETQGNYHLSMTNHLFFALSLSESCENIQYINYTCSLLPNSALKALNSFILKQLRSQRAFPSLHLLLLLWYFETSVICLGMCVFVLVCGSLVKLHINVLELFSRVFYPLKRKQAESSLMLK